MIQERNYHIDNIKIFLLFLVAFAHTLIPFRELNSCIDWIIKMIYFCHMPMFAWIVGYLVGKSKRGVWGYIKKLLVPYVVFQTAYVILGKIMVLLKIMEYSANTMTMSLVEPSSPLYFLLCMMIWRLMCQIFDELPENVVVNFTVLAIIAVLISVDSYSNTIIMPIFSLLPFYYLGYKSDSIKVHNVTNHNMLTNIVCVGGYI